MRLKGPEKSSILLLGRNTVVIGAVVIIVVSFVFGYFFGYKGTDILEKGKHDSESRVAAAPEDKKTLDNADNSPVLPPVIKPSEFPKEAVQQKPSTPEPQKPDNKALAEQKNQEVAKADAGKGPLSPQAGLESPDSAGTEKERPAKESAGTGKVTGKTKKNSSPQKILKPSKTAKKQKETESAKGTYTVQVGAFPSREGAEQLLQGLKAKNIKAYIVDSGEGNPYFRVRTGTFKSRKDAEQMSSQLQKKDGLQNFVTTK